MTVEKLLNLPKNKDQKIRYMKKNDNVIINEWVIFQKEAHFIVPSILNSLRRDMLTVVSFVSAVSWKTLIIVNNRLHCYMISCK